MRPATLALFALLAACAKDDVADSTGTRPEGPLQYTPIAPWEQLMFEDRAVLWYLPPNPRGIVPFFHGTGGNVGVVRHIEVVAFLNEMIGAGVGFVATDGSSAEGNWTEADVERVGRLYEHLVDTTALEPTDAIFPAGFSGGGGMTGDFAAYGVAQGWPIKAANPNQSNCYQCRDLDVPTIWVLNENDTDPHAGAEENAGKMRDRGVDTRILYIDELVMTPDSFLKHPTMTEERSQRVFDDLVFHEMIDGAGVRLVPDDQLEPSVTWYESNGQSFSPGQRAEEIRVIWAMHRFAGDRSREVRDFLLDQL